MAIIQIKQYNNYTEYLTHQREKTANPTNRKIWLSKEWSPKIKLFEKFFQHTILKYPKIKGQKAIGLGARTGQEIQAMLNVGLNAIGIDIVPCKPLVIAGDIHNIPFKDNTFYFAYSNMFDHVLYPDIFVKEIQRIVCHEGLVLLHIATGKLGKYECTEIQNIKDITILFSEECIIWQRQIPKMLGGVNWEILLQVNKLTTPIQIKHGSSLP